jgi:hypothetical protein
MSCYLSFVDDFRTVVYGLSKDGLNPKTSSELRKRLKIVFSRSEELDPQTAGRTARDIRYRTNCTQEAYSKAQSCGSCFFLAFISTVSPAACRRYKKEAMKLLKLAETNKVHFTLRYNDLTRLKSWAKTDGYSMDEFDCFLQGLARTPTDFEVFQKIIQDRGVGDHPTIISASKILFPRQTGDPVTPGAFPVDDMMETRDIIEG